MLRNIPRKVSNVLTRPSFRVKFIEPMAYVLKSKNPAVKLFMGAIQVVSAVPYFFRGMFVIEMNERIVERPFLYQNLDLKKGSKILEFGCCMSRLAVELASLGYKVTGVDLNDYEFKHPNLTFIHGDFFDSEFKDNEFDAVLAVSSVEHAGLGHYHEKEREGGDFRIVDEIRRILKPGGRFIITVPFGSGGQTKSYRIYDSGRLDRLLEGFRIDAEEHCIKKGRTWIPASRKTASGVDSSKGARAVAMVSCRKKG